MKTYKEKGHGKKKIKPVKGEASNYITRAQAVRKLQINLSDFRKLCILKGIYPREPKNKKKAGRGSTALRTFYYRKDIQYLMHEPILAKLRELKTFEKKVKKAVGKRQDAVVNSLYDNKPEYTLDRIVKERYPSFIDALRDMDDALSMIFLFSTLPTDDKIANYQVKECQRLSAEFQNYIMISKSLLKTFLSIKGIYYQAEVKGQTITWIVPYSFSQDVPTDVDFRVMSTFLDFYRTLIGFINYKLYTDINLVYPPVLDKSKDDEGAGLGAYIIESSNSQDVVKTLQENTDSVSVNPSVIRQDRLETLNEKIALIGDEQEDENSDDEKTDVEDLMDEVDSIPVPAVPAKGDDEIIPSLNSWLSNEKENASFHSLFGKMKFYLNREVPRYSLEFVIRSFGGQIGWDETSGAGSPYKIDDSRITHHIIDRPFSDDLKGLEREFLQPQWIYDCINARKILKTKGYHPGETLPPHLSPFVEVKEGDYVPEVTMTEEKLPEAEMVNESDEEMENSEEIHQQELEAEASGMTFAEYSNIIKEKTTSVKTKNPKQVPDEAEARELAKIMMSKKEKRLYSQIQHSKKKRTDAADVLMNKKKNLKKQ